MPSWPLIPMTFLMGGFSHERLRARLLRGARKEYEALDGSVRSMLNKGLADSAFVPRR